MGGRRPAVAGRGERGRRRAVVGVRAADENHIELDRVRARPRLRAPPRSSAARSPPPTPRGARRSASARRAGAAAATSAARCCRCEAFAGMGRVLRRAPAAAVRAGRAATRAPWTAAASPWSSGCARGCRRRVRRRPPARADPRRPLGRQRPVRVDRCRAHRPGGARRARPDRPGDAGAVRHAAPGAGRGRLRRGGAAARRLAASAPACTSCTRCWSTRSRTVRATATRPFGWPGATPDRTGDGTPDPAGRDRRPAPRSPGQTGPASVVRRANVRAAACRRRVACSSP